MTMTELRDRFRAADQIPAPDLWPAVESNLAGATPDRPLRLAGAGESSPRRAVAGRILTIAAALLIVALAFGWLLRSIATSETVPGGEPSTSAFIPTPNATTAQVRGWIAFTGASGQLMATDPVTTARPEVLWFRGEPVAWSPDGTRLLMTDGWVLNADATRTHVVTGKQGIQGGSFSPDGNQIVYSDYEGSLHVVGAGGGEPQLLAAGDGDTYLLFPAWSPDGASIAYITHTGSTKGDTISIMRADGADRRVLIDLTHRQDSEIAPLVWSPDGSRLAFSENSTCCSTDHSWVSVIDADGSGLQTVTPPDGSWGPTWSPDGQRIAFTRHQQIFTMAADGTDVRLVTRSEVPYFRIAWNPAS